MYAAVAAEINEEVRMTVQRHYHRTDKRAAQPGVVTKNRGRPARGRGYWEGQEHLGMAVGTPEFDVHVLIVRFIWNWQRFSRFFVRSGLQKYVDLHQQGRASRAREEANVAHFAASGYNSL